MILFFFGLDPAGEGFVARRVDCEDYAFLLNGKRVKIKNILKLG